MHIIFGEKQSKIQHIKTKVDIIHFIYKLYGKACVLLRLKIKHWNDRTTEKIN